MLKYRTAVLASAAALCVVAGATALAMDQSHVMKIDLPDGSIARIDYQGNVAPQVRVEPAVQFMPAAFVDPFEPVSFDAFGAIAADMTRQAETMVRQMDLLQREAMASDRTVRPTVLANLPAGQVSYRYVSTDDGKSVCTQTWQMTSQGDHRPPTITSASYGNCAMHDTSPQPSPGRPQPFVSPGRLPPRRRPDCRGEGGGAAARALLPHPGLPGSREGMPATIAV